MEIKYIIVLIVGLINVILGFFILKKNPKSPINFWYFLLCFTGGGWAVVKFFQLTTLDLYWQYGLLTKLMYIAGTFATFTYLMLTYHFPYKLKHYSQKTISLIFIVPMIVAISVALGVLVPNESFIVNNQLHREVNLLDFTIFFIYFYLYIILGFIMLFIKYFKNSGIYKRQIKYLIIATVTTFMTIGVFSMILPFLNNWSYDWFGAILLIIHFIVAGYLIFYKSSKAV